MQTRNSFRGVARVVALAAAAMVAAAFATAPRPAAAADTPFSFETGYALQWLNVDGVDIDLETIDAGFLYEVMVKDGGSADVLDPGDWGWSTMGNVLAAKGTADESAWILAFEFGPWITIPGGLDLVARFRYEHYTAAMLGERTQSIGGSASLVLPVPSVEDLGLVVGYRFNESVAGVEDVSSQGFHLGPQIAF